MNAELIKQWMEIDWIRKRILDKKRVKSMIESSITNMNIVKTIPLNEKSAILIFRETYESIRQLGDAKWWLYNWSVSCVDDSTYARDGFSNEFVLNVI